MAHRRARYALPAENGPVEGDRHPPWHRDRGQGHVSAARRSHHRGRLPPMTTLVLIAKEPIAGRVKTRLHPPLTLDQAALLAAAAIDDTLVAIETLPASRRVLLFDGERVPEAAAHYEVFRQVGGPLDERLAALFDAMEGPTVLIGMDTPQLRPSDLAPAFVWSDDV